MYRNHECIERSSRAAKVKLSVSMDSFFSVLDFFEIDGEQTSIYYLVGTLEKYGQSPT